MLMLRLICFSSIHAEDPIKIKMTVEVCNGTGDDPMVVAWLETGQKSFIKTLHMFSKDHEYYKDMTLWYTKRKKRREKQAYLDAVVGATCKWRQKKSAWLKLYPHKRFGKGYVIRVESRKDKGGHYKSFKIPYDEAVKGGTFTHKGYVRKVTFVPQTPS